MSAIEQLLASRDDGPTAGRPRLPSSARLTLILVLASTAVILPFSHHDLGPQRTFIPLVLTVVVVLDLVSVYLLTVRFCDTGDLRILLMALAYLWSCLMVVAWAMSFPGVISDHPPIGTWPSATPWIYLAWHVGFPALMAVAWGIPGRCAKTVPDGRRRRVATALIAASIVTALVVIAGIAVGEHVLPVLIVGVDTTRMSTIGGPPSMLIAVASAVIVHVRLRHRSGPERWASVTVWVCVADLTLTFWSLHRYSVGWYAGRTLTVVCSSLVFFAMLGEFTALQRRLLRARNEAVSAAIMQRNFAMSASHELRTPTTSILGYIEEVLDNEKLDEEDREMLDIAHRNTQRLARLVDDLLILGEAEMGPAMMHLEPCPLAPLFESVTRSFAAAALRQGVQLRTNSVEDLPLVMIDPVRTEQAVANLVSNALKFTPPGGEVNLAAHRGDKMIELTVSDSGVGIDPAEVERVFERFYRSKAAVDTAVKGTGLGLAIVRTIVEAQRGNVSVESTLGRGTSFRLTLPLADKLPEPV